MKERLIKSYRVFEGIKEPGITVDQVVTDLLIEKEQIEIENNFAGYKKLRRQMSLLILKVCSRLSTINNTKNLYDLEKLDSDLDEGFA